MTSLPDDLLRIAAYLEGLAGLGGKGTGPQPTPMADTCRLAAQALRWVPFSEAPPPLGEYVLIWVPSRPWISKSPTVFAKVARRLTFHHAASGHIWEGFGPDTYDDHEIAAWMPIHPPEPQ